MLVSLYTSRVILQALGEVDFGIYNVVGGVIVLFTFINNAMTASTQRYLNYSLGEIESTNLTHVFSQAMVAHIIIAGGIILLGETIGLYIVETKLNIPPDRVNAAYWVYQLTILSAVFSILRCPYNASIIAYEEMSFYARISILEAVMKLAIAFAIKIDTFDKLIIYASMMTSVSLIVTALYYLFCVKKFSMIRFKYRKDYKLLREMSLFSVWSLLGSATNVGINQGASIILNIFFGVIVNSAMGIANQLNAVASSFVSNFQTAFMPQITKSYASGDKTYLMNLILNTSRYSFLLLFIVSAPVFFNCEYILSLWLGNVPPYTFGLVRIIIISSIFDTLSGPLWMAVHSRGNIRNYQIYISIISLLNIVLLYVVAKLGYNPIVTFSTKILVLGFLYFFRIFYLDKVILIRISQWFKEVYFRIFIIISAVTVFSLFVRDLSSPFVRLSLYTLFGLFLVVLIGLKSSERLKIIYMIKLKLHIGSVK